MEKFYYNSQIGYLEIMYENNELISLKPVKKIQKSNNETDFTKDIKKQLDEYFRGERKKFDVKINPKGTEFQKRVWNELKNIPYGTTKSYCEIAKNIGNENAQRATGSACNKNPVMIIIPCHRVISKSGALGGFAYGNEIKEKLLKIENINFKLKNRP